ncbi:serine/threonine protein phosphatase [Acuticoccus sediminis]|uniref:Serine/threonine protein phosphatase n=1 Tax=Acuticoccus sediminis TaxID=2184697 RepID=A0A8B2NXC6_9HYPH|nr:metallophosphoesterase family protein [Acuticoccus sediminis]RAI00438.1 serine/threonine protein phosphatase [Acuticoccus sediminis]
MNADLPEGVRVYAIGDVHGCAKMLDRLLALIDEDLAADPATSVVEVFLGDYVDRGPDCAAVLKRVGEEVPGRERVRLMGNHEQAMIAALADGTMMSRWLAFGGDATLRSYGIEPNDWKHDPQALQPIVQSVLPRRDLELLTRLAYSHRIGGVIFVHAGIRPGVPLEEQSSSDMIWIREEFLTHSGPFPAFVVHGHTPVDAPEVTPWRANVDTGAVYGGALTAIVLEAGRRHRFLSVPHG